MRVEDTDFRGIGGLRQGVAIFIFYFFLSWGFLVRFLFCFGLPFLLGCFFFFFF